MPSFSTKEIGISQGNSKLELNYASGDYVCHAGEDDGNWGNPLNKQQWNNTDIYVFNDKYIYISVFVDCNWNEFTAPDKISMSITGGKDNGETKTIRVIDNETPGINNVYGSRNKDFSRDDGRVLLRFNVSTSELWDISYITQIDIKANYSLGGGDTLNGTWKLQDCTVYQSYFWKNNGGDGYFATDWRLNNYNKYSSNKISTPITYDGRVEISALQNDGTKNKKYFDSAVTLGYIEIIFHFSKYLSNDSYRMPNKIKFIDNVKKRVYNLTLLGSIIPDPTYTHKIKASTLKTSQGEEGEKLTEISEAQMEFGDGRYITVPLDCILKDIQPLIENYEKKGDTDDLTIALLEQQGDNIYNEYIETFIDEEEKTPKVKLKSKFKGTFVLPASFPYVMKEGGNFKLSKVGTDTNVASEISSSVFEKPKGFWQINMENIYDCKAIDNGQKLDFSSCKLVAGDYQLKIDVTNKLEFDTNTKKELWTFPKKIKIGKKEDEVVFLKTPAIEIRYQEGGNYYQVPGNILLEWEKLYFPENSFFIYSLADGKRIGQDNNNVYLTIDGTKIDESIKVEQEYYSYKFLKQRKMYVDNGNIPNEIETDETIKLSLGYVFNGNNKKTVYSPTSVFFLGRTVESSVLTLNTKNETINYILQDNGGDRDIVEDNIILTSNSLIERRKNDKGYFSLARAPGSDGSLKEKASLTLLTENDEIIESTELILNPEDMLIQVLELLKINKTQNLSLNLFGLGFEDVKDRKIKVKIEIIYVYDKDKDVAKTIATYVTEPLYFTSVKSPLGLRKDGVIINPKQDENIEQTNGRKNTFIINVPEVIVNNNIYTPINGLRILFGSNKYFEIYLGEDDAIHLTNCKIDPAPTTET